MNDQTDANYKLMLSKLRISCKLLILWNFIKHLFSQWLLIPGPSNITNITARIPQQLIIWSPAGSEFEERTIMDLSMFNQFLRFTSLINVQTNYDRLITFRTKTNLRIHHFHLRIKLGNGAEFLIITKIECQLINSSWGYRSKHKLNEPLHFTGKWTVKCEPSLLQRCRSVHHVSTCSRATRATGRLHDQRLSVTDKSYVIDLLYCSPHTDTAPSDYVSQCQVAYVCINYL